MGEMQVFLSGPSGETSLMPLPIPVYEDDTIDVAKRKIFLGSQDSDRPLPPVCQYLYAPQSIMLDATQVLSRLSTNAALDTVSTDRIRALLMNCGLERLIPTLPTTDTMDLGDLLAMETWGSKVEMLTPLGYPPDSFPPFPTVPSATLVERDSLFVPSERALVASSFRPLRQAIFVVVPSENGPRLDAYFPALHQLNIGSQADLQKRLPSLVAEAGKTVGAQFRRKQECITMLKQVQPEPTPLVRPSEPGVTLLEIELTPEVAFKAPLDTIFRLLNASESLPWIKLNMGDRSERVYRLYAPDSSPSGRAVPAMSKARILALAREEGRLRSVTVLAVRDEDQVICTFLPSGSVRLRSSFSPGTTYDEAIAHLAQIGNPVILKAGGYLSRRGYDLPQLVSGTQMGLRIIKATAFQEFEIAEKFRLSAVKGCSRCAFVTVADQSKGDISLRFQRVAQYNSMQGVDASIGEGLRTGLSPEQVATDIMSSFDLTQDEARASVVSFLATYEQRVELTGSGKRLIVPHPGLNTTISYDKFTQKLAVSVLGIDNPLYLETALEMFRSLLYIAVAPDATGQPPERLRATCVSKGKIEEDNLPAVLVTPTAPATNLLHLDDDTDDEDLADLMLGSDTDSDSEGSPMVGGARDVDGLSLTNPNPFFKRLKERAPEMFAVENDGRFKAYSRLCPWNVKRQPVILTAAEKERIDKEHPGSYGQAVKYQVPGQPTYWYICPRYWSLSHETSLTEEEAKSGKYGEIIPEGAKRATTDQSIFEFTSSKHLNADGEYESYEPGFLKTTAHPEGLCLPCCFKTWDSPEQKRRKETCEGTVRQDAPSAAVDEYVQAVEKFPLPPGRYGYLPLVLQRLFGVDNRSCQVSDVNPALKPNTPCLLRRGVQTNRLQSFVACIADAWKPEDVPSIAEMRVHLADTLELDDFMLLQNGALALQFASTKPQGSREEGPYRLSATTDAQRNAVANIQAAYTNYKEWLRGSDTRLDHVHLWDLVTIPRAALWPNGINLIILERQANDITDNVRLVCPTNAYAQYTYIPSRPTLILYKVGDFYEPLYQFEDTRSNFRVKRLFNATDPGLIESVRARVKALLSTGIRSCGPLMSQPTRYQFSPPVHPKTIEGAAMDQGEEIVRQIINYSGQVILLETSSGFVLPCTPSPVLNLANAEIAWMDDTSLAFGVEEVLEGLRTVRAGIEPRLKIIEDGALVGILTNTDQVIPILPPVPDTASLNLPPLEGTSPYKADIAKAASLGQSDAAREKAIIMLRAETGFTNAYKERVRRLVQRYNFADTRKQLLGFIASNEPYMYKLVGIQRIIDRMMAGEVRFVPMRSVEKVQEELGKVENCDDTCVIALPETNLVNGKENQRMYSARVADELIRFTQMRDYYLNPQTYLALGTVPYNLGDDEIIVLQSVLTQEYFHNLIAAPSPGIHLKKTFFTSQPELTEGGILFEEELEAEAIDDERDTKDPKELEQREAACDPPTRTVVAGTYKSVFPVDSIELIFPTSPLPCTFDLIRTIHEREYGIRPGIHEMKMSLQAMYDQLELSLLQKAIAAEGKRVPKGVDVGTWLMTDSFYVTALDIWLLSIRYQLPIVMYSSTKLKLTQMSVQPAYGPAEGAREYYFIKLGGTVLKTPPSQRLIVTKEGISLIPISEVSLDMQRAVNAAGEVGAMERLIAGIGAVKTRRRLKVT